MNKETEKKKTQKNKSVNFIKEQTNMPPIALADLSYIEITEKNYIELEGVKKIIECGNDRIKIKFKDCIAQFCGTDLYIRNYNEKSAIIEGEFSSIIFE